MLTDDAAAVLVIENGRPIGQVTRTAVFETPTETSV
jgi:osmoprotectant transport system ATP-binding protein